jgi:nicotinate-nucleotide pyrophosphorylase (carboxylating)
MPLIPDDIKQVVQQALAEDVGTGDITAALIPEQQRSTAHILCREDAIICGAAWFDEVFRQVDNNISIDWHVHDGDNVQANQEICILKGSSRSLLTAERTALNFLQTLSAIATQTHAYVEAIKDTGARVLDTRKTLPGLRTAEKYAVACGGGHNHRMGLFDAFLIKENHIKAAGSIAAAVQAARTQHPELKVEVEVENLEELQDALSVGADQILLDNMTLSRLREAVTINKGRAKLEASGGVTLTSIRDIANTGVDYISVGSLTKNIRAIDLSMRFVGESAD